LRKGSDGAEEDERAVGKITPGMGLILLVEEVFFRRVK